MQVSAEKVQLIKDASDAGVAALSKHIGQLLAQGIGLPVILCM
jgi:hypothetical protein